MRKALLGTVLCLAAAMLSGGSGPPAATGTAPSSPSTSTTPTPSPSVRTKAKDLAELKSSLVTAKDLGKPWVRPASVSSNGKAGEICPGHHSAAAAVRTTASTGTKLTEGSGSGKNIGSFSLSTLTTADASALRTAFQKDQRVCARYTDASRLYVVRTAGGPTSLEHADEVVAAWAERICYDKAHRKLAYARHVVVARSGRVITYVEYAFLTVAAAPSAKDFTRAERLVEVQLAKVAQQVTA